MRLFVLSGVLVAVVLSTGCGKDDGPKRYRVSGTVAIDGQPIPFGEIIFTPDAAKKNSGPQGRAPIQEGKFDTAAPGGLGVGGGPTVLLVNGMTKPGGQTLCEYELKLDLPKSDTTQDVAVPKQKPKPKGPLAKEI